MSRSPWKPMPAWAALVFALAALAAGPPEKPGPSAGPAECAPAGRPYLSRKSIVARKGHFGQGDMKAYPDAVILRLHGLPYEMGYQHGAMLKGEIRERMERLRDDAGPWEALRGRARATSWRRSWPARAREEIKGMARGSGIPVMDLAWLNLVYAQEGDTQGKGENIRGPEWIIVVYNPEGGEKAAMVTWPGAIGAVAGISGPACCAADLGGEERASSWLSLRESLQDGSRGTPEGNRCEALPAVVLDGAKGLVCVDMGGGSWGAIDIETGSWRPRCKACAPPPAK